MNTAFLGYLWCAGAAIASALASLLMKFSSNHGDGLTLLRMVWLGSACFSYALGFVCYSVALQKLQISLAYPVMTAITLALVTAIGYLVLNEPLTPAKLIGIGLVAIGAFVLVR